MKHTIHTLLFFLLVLPAAKAQDSNRLEQAIQEGRALTYSYRFDEALLLYNEVYNEHPQNLRLLLQMGYCHQQMGRYPDAKLFYGEALKVDSLNTKALSAVGSIYEQERNFRQAKQYFNQLTSIDSTNAYYYKRLGKLSLQTNQALPALAYYLKAHELNGADIAVITRLSDLYLAMGQLDGAEQMIRKGLSLDGKNIQLLQAQARLHHKRKAHEEVVETVERTMALGDTSNYYQMLLGVAYLQVDSTDRAIHHLEQIVARKKDTEHTHHYLGLAYRNKKDYPQSRLHLEKAIEKGLSPKLGDYYRELGGLHDQQGDWKAAITQYEKALDYGAGIDVRFQLARAADQYYRDKSIAQRHYQRYLDRGGEQYAAYARQRLEQIREIIHFQK
jgi:tetratricopeptide (TPR) repeat protein